MDLQLENKFALVVGGSRGIGAATSRVLVEEGADVAFTYHSSHVEAERLLRELERHGPRVRSFPVDVSSSSQVAELLESVDGVVSGIDLLVICAGLNLMTPFLELSTGEWERVVDTNLNGPFRVIQQAIPRLRDGASVTIVSSVSGHTGAPHHAHYAAAKAGVINLTKSAARALGPRVRVNCIAPGMTLTEMGKLTASHLPADYLEKKLLVSAYAQPEEIARVIAFVASPLCRFMTGSTIDVNGGRLLR